MKRLVVVALAIGLFNSCYMRKHIDKPVNVYIDTWELRTQLLIDCPNPQYINYKTQEEYQEEFINALKEQAALQANVRLTTFDSADYMLKVLYFEIKEGESTETVNDEKSPYNGQQYNLSYINEHSSFDIMKGQEKLGNWGAYQDKSEKLKNDQSLFQKITKTNADNTEYREKLMQDDVCMDLARKCGRHTWNLFTQKLSKVVK